MAKTAGAHLLEFICPKCDKHVAWALPRATVICAWCGVKITVKNTKRHNPARLPAEGEQLVLFSELSDS